MPVQNLIARRNGCRRTAAQSCVATHMGPGFACTFSLPVATGDSLVRGLIESIDESD